MSACNDPNCAHCRLPLWVQMSGSSKDREVREAGNAVRAHQAIYGENHIPCEVRNKAEVLKARCCICNEHTQGCVLHVIDYNSNKKPVIITI